jgi:hypothetical protein
MQSLLAWLIQGGIGPATVALPVDWTAAKLAKAARDWFRRLRRSDGLSRIVMAATEGQTALLDTEFAEIRQLLEKESTWEAVGERKVEDLAAKIAPRLTGQRTKGDKPAAAWAIAEGLLEFAVRDLEPQWFSQVLFARLNRLQTDQASALDQAILGVHADLAALFAHHDATDADRFARVTGQMAQVLDRLPPGPADRGEVAIYLTKLIRWLGTDAWPQDALFKRPVLRPASIERQLKVAVKDGQGKQVRDADDLARHCLRLVVLGGPGSGKTWLARRAVRLCAEAAIDALAAGDGLDEVELPLFITCARLATTTPTDNIRRAVVASALGPLPDLGGSRITEAIRVLFEERNAPTLLVADSLDEARGADDRIRQADTLPLTWRIILTSRPGSWNRQFAAVENDPVRQVGRLQPLRYPEDVDAFIRQWFSERPAHAASLATQIRKHPALQEAATVPLILAFYCIVGGDQPLPARRADLYAEVIKRMLTGRWRGSGGSDPNPQAYLKTLRTWAWSAAKNDPVSGVADWPEDFRTAHVPHPGTDQDALDHVAVATGPPNLDGERKRRFVHRSLRQHLVAEHVALEMPASQAAQELLNHLWYDPEWEYAGPAALAIHPQREQVLREIIRHITGSEQLGVNLAEIDDCWQIRLFLARVAQESAESSWPPDTAEFIGQARLDLVKSQQHDLREIVTPDWPISNGPIIESLQSRLGNQADSWRARELMKAIAELDPDEDRRPQRRPRLAAVGEHDHGFRAWKSTEATARLYPTEGERAHFHRIVRAAINPGSGDESARTAHDRQALLVLLHEASPWAGQALSATIARLAATNQDRAYAREALLALLDGRKNPETAQALARAVATLDPTQQDLARARQALLTLLDQAGPHIAQELARAVATLDPTQEDLARARHALLTFLEGQDHVKTAQALAKMVATLDPTEEDLARGRHALLTLADSQIRRDARGLANSVVSLTVTAEDRAQARQALLTLLENGTKLEVAQLLARKVAALGPTQEDRARTRHMLLALLADQSDHLDVRDLAQAVARLAVTPGERGEVREALLTMHDRQANYRAAQELMVTAAGLAVTLEDQAEARRGLLVILSSQTNPEESVLLARAVRGLDPSKEEMAQARRFLLRLLGHRITPRVARYLAQTIEMLEPAHDDQARTRQALLALLDEQENPEDARPLVDAIATLNPTIAELDGAAFWSFRSDPKLLAAARRNSRLSEWLAFLPRLRLRQS